MSQATPLRSVMDEAEYQRERSRIDVTYGGPDDDLDDLIAKRDQAFADLFYRSGWSQSQLAEHEGRSISWVSCRLRFGRFLAYSTNCRIDDLRRLTEGRFRSLWELTDKDNTDAARFEAVVGFIASPPPKKAKRETPTLDVAREIVRPLVESGSPVNTKILAKEHGISHVTFEAAKACEHAVVEERRAAPQAEALIDKSILSASAREKYEALEARLNREFASRVQLEVERHINATLMPYYKDRLEKAEMVLAYKKPFTNAEFLSLLRALHSDSTNAENRQAAFVLLKEKQMVLRPEEKDRPLSGGLPKTLGELLARKKTKARV